MNSNEIVLHVRKLFDSYMNEFKQMNLVAQDRCEGEHWYRFAQEVERFLKELDKP